MNAPVGAFVEEVAPRPLLQPADRGYLLLLLLIAFALHAWLLTHTCTTARDSLRFGRAALNLEHPSAKTGTPRTFNDVLCDAKEFPDPPGFPLAVLGASKIVREAFDASLPVQMLVSAQVASCFAAILLVLPSYWLGRMLFGSPFAGFAAAALFQVLPTVAHITSDGLSDSTSLLCIVTALVCAVRAVRTQSTKWFLAAGVASGCGYLVRPEGMIALPALGLITLALTVNGAWPWRVALGRLIAAIIGVVIISLPYMVLIGGISNKPSINEPLKKLMPARMLLADQANPGLALRAEWYSGQGSQSIWALKAIVKETSKTCHYSVFVLGIVGLMLLGRRGDTAMMLVIVTALMQLVLLFALAMKPMPADLGPGSEAVPPYLSERHTLLLAFFACLFTGGLLAVQPRIGWLVLVAIAASALPSALKPLHENRAGHYHAGLYLQGKIGPNDAVIDPFEWAHWYSGRALYHVPPDPADAVLEVRWVVWEPTAGTKQNPHSRLPRLEVARNVIVDGANPPQLVYHWPEHLDPEQAKVVVYKQIVRK